MVIITAMKQKWILLMLGLLTFGNSYGQDEEKYAELIKEAWHLYETEEYLQSGQKYSEAFVALGNLGYEDDRYNAACSWALVNQKDSAFAQLFRIARKVNYSNINHITTDTDLKLLHSDKRWNEVITIVRDNKEREEAHLDKPLVAILDTIYTEDQKYRLQLDEIEEKHGWASEEVRVHWKLINEKDSVNLAKIIKILDERGWLGPDIIGRQGTSTLFLVIQHSDPGTQRKYLPMMREAVKMGKASPSSLALLEDRVALGKGEKQIYGSQIGRDYETGEHYVLPLVDPDNVDSRRSKVGLGSIQDYISHWDMTWDVEEYKKLLVIKELRQNPTSFNSSVMIEDPGLEDLEDVSVDIYDGIGRLVIRINRVNIIAHGRLELELPKGNLKPGLYSYTLRSGMGVLARGKLVVE